MKIKILKTVFQLIANYILFMLENSHNKKMFDYYYELGCKLDSYCVYFHDIYLD